MYLYSIQTLNGDDASWSALKWMRLIMLMDIFIGQYQNKIEISKIKGSKGLLSCNSQKRTSNLEKWYGHVMLKIRPSYTGFIKGILTDVK